MRRGWTALACSAIVAGLAASGCGGEERERAKVPPARALSSAICSPVSYEGEGRPRFLVVGITALQGDFTDHGVQTVQALKMVLGQRRWRAGDNTVALQICDESDAETGLGSERKCARLARVIARNRSVVAVVGPLLSSCARRMLATLNRAPDGPVAVISGSNTYVGLTRPAPGTEPDEPEVHYPTRKRHYVRLAASDDAQGAASVLLAKERGARAVVALHDGDAYGLGVASAFVASARRAGLRARLDEWDPEARDYRGLARRAAADGADAVFLGGIPGNNGPRLIRDLRAAVGPDALLMGSDAFNMPALLVEEAGDAAEGFVVGIAVIPTRTLPPPGRRFAAEFERRFDAKPCCFSVHSAQAMLMVLDAIEASDGSRAGVVDELLGSRVAGGLIGDFAVTPSGDSTLTSIALYGIQQGRLRFLRTISAPARLLGRG